MYIYIYISVCCISYIYVNKRWVLYLTEYSETFNDCTLYMPVGDYSVGGDYSVRRIMGQKA